MEGGWWAACSLTLSLPRALPAPRLRAPPCPSPPTACPQAEPWKQRSFFLGLCYAGPHPHQPSTLDQLHPKHLL